MLRSVCLEDPLKPHLSISSHKQQKKNYIDNFPVIQKLLFIKNVGECSHVASHNPETKKYLILDTCLQ